MAEHSEDYYEVLGEGSCAHPFVADGLPRGLVARVWHGLPVQIVCGALSKTRFLKCSSRMPSVCVLWESDYLASVYLSWRARSRTDGISVLVFVCVDDPFSAGAMGNPSSCSLETVKA